MGAKKTGGGAANRRNANIAMAVYMAKHNIKRTTHRDPITNKIVANGTYPGTSGGKGPAW